MAEYNVTITNGSGSQVMTAGTYDVEATVTGYDGTFSPETFTATRAGASEDFTIAATGTLDLVFNETGASGGTPITDGTVQRCNIDGTSLYGSVVDISGTGTCQFPYVPYGTVGTPYVFYVKQLTTDATHDIYNGGTYEGVYVVSMTASTDTQYVQNDLAASQTFTFEDANYSGLPISGSLDFTPSI